MFDTIVKCVKRALSGKVTVATSDILAPAISKSLIDKCPHLCDKWISVDVALPPEMCAHSSGWSEEVRPSISVIVHRKDGSRAIAWWSYCSNDWTTEDETNSFNDVLYWHRIPKLTEEDS